jgi:hypothetical protein
LEISTENALVLTNHNRRKAVPRDGISRKVPLFGKLAAPGMNLPESPF